MRVKTHLLTSNHFEIDKEINKFLEKSNITSDQLIDIKFALAECYDPDKEAIVHFEEALVVYKITD